MPSLLLKNNKKGRIFNFPFAKWRKNPHHTTGQVMLLTVLIFGGAILGATTIAGLLMLYQLRQNTDTSNSAKAIFGADTGIQWGLYQFSKPTSTHSMPSLSNGTIFSATCYDKQVNKLDSCTNSSTSIIIATSSAGSSERALELSF